MSACVVGPKPGNSGFFSPPQEVYFASQRAPPPLADLGELVREMVGFGELGGPGEGEGVEGPLPHHGRLAGGGARQGFLNKTKWLLLAKNFFAIKVLVFFKINPSNAPRRLFVGTLRRISKKKLLKNQN